MEIPSSSPLVHKSNTDKHACMNTTQKSHIRVKCADVRSVHVSFRLDMDNELVVRVVTILPAIR